MHILITGARGFIGKNLVLELRNQGYADIFEYDIDTPEEQLDYFCASCDFVFHLAGVNRPQNPEEFMSGNFGFTSVLLEKLKGHGNKAPVLVTSSIQADMDNPYGKSKQAGEELMFAYSKETGAEVFVYRLPNVFGKWCRPNYNSAVATFCSNIANGLPITINDRSTIMSLVYIDDVVAEFISALCSSPNKSGRYCQVATSHQATLGEISDLINSFKLMSETLRVPDVSDPLVKKLHATYLSYLPVDGFSYPLKMNVDERGSFTEIIRTITAGQVAVNISKPHIVKGNHWHHTKNEKFVVVSGTGIIRFRKIGSNDIVEYRVNGEKIEVVDIPTGYIHNIENIGDSDMVTIMWCNECFDKEHPDTFFEKV